MATRVKGKIGKRIAKRAKAGKSVELGLGPGAASLVGKSAATKLAALAKRISAAKKAKGVRGNAEALRQLELKTKGKLSRPRPSKKAPPPKGSISEAKAKKKMIKVSVKGPISSTITDAGTKAAVAARKAKRVKQQDTGMSKLIREGTARRKADFAKSQKRAKEVAELVKKSNAQADRLAGKKPPRQPTTGMPARQSSGSGFNPKAAAEARKTPAKRALEARQRAQRNR